MYIKLFLIIIITILIIYNCRSLYPILNKKDYFTQNILTINNKDDIINNIDYIILTYYPFINLNLINNTLKKYYKDEKAKLYDLIYYNYNTFNDNINKFPFIYMPLVNNTYLQLHGIFIQTIMNINQKDINNETIKYYENNDDIKYHVKPFTIGYTNMIDYVIIPFNMPDKQIQLAKQNLIKLDNFNITNINDKCFNNDSLCTYNINNILYSLIEPFDKYKDIINKNKTEIYDMVSLMILSIFIASDIDKEKQNIDIADNEDTINAKKNFNEKLYVEYGFYNVNILIHNIINNLPNDIKDIIIKSPNYSFFKTS